MKNCHAYRNRNRKFNSSRWCKQINEISRDIWLLNYLDFSINCMEKARKYRKRRHLIGSQFMAKISNPWNQQRKKIYDRRHSSHIKGILVLCKDELVLNFYVFNFLKSDKRLELMVSYFESRHWNIPDFPLPVRPTYKIFSKYVFHNNFHLLIGHLYWVIYISNMICEKIFDYLKIKTLCHNVNGPSLLTYHVISRHAIRLNGSFDKWILILNIHEPSAT